MGFWVYLFDEPEDEWRKTHDPDKEDQRGLPCETFVDGGTHFIGVGGWNTCELSITYDYSPHFYRELCRIHGLRCLHGMQAEKTIPALERAVKALGTDRDVDYWNATPGNAGAALARLLEWAKAHPKGFWAVHYR